MESFRLRRTDINLPFLAVNDAGPQHLMATIFPRGIRMMVSDLGQ